MSNLDLKHSQILIARIVTMINKVDHQWDLHNLEIIEEVRDKIVEIVLV